MRLAFRLSNPALSALIVRKAEIVLSRATRVPQLGPDMWASEK
jgi:hypothetical protein